MSEIWDIQVTNQQKLRKEYVHASFPIITEDKDRYNSHEEYMAALRQQYQAMREYEWELICQQEALDMHNISANSGQDPNSAIWSGYKETTAATNAAAQDSSFVCRPPEVRMPIPGLENIHAGSCCAGTAIRLNNSISERFGYAGEDRFYNSAQHHSAASARAIHDNKATKSYRHQNRSLKAMIDEGLVGPGTILSIPMANSNSKYHVITVAGVIKDENGKVTQVLLQANNNTNLVAYNTSTIDSSLQRWSNPPSNDDFIITSTQDWAKKTIENEVNNMSEAELLKAISDTRSRIDSSIDRLASIEQKTLTLGNLKFQKNYRNFMSTQAKDLKNNTIRAHLDHHTLLQSDPLPILSQTPTPIQSNISNVELKTEMRGQSQIARKNFEIAQGNTRSVLKDELKTMANAMPTPTTLIEQYNEGENPFIKNKDNNQQKTNAPTYQFMLTMINKSKSYG